MLGIPAFLAVCLLSAADGSTDDTCFPSFIPWKSNNIECWNSCGSDSYCPNTCGFGGYCCRNGYSGDCPVGASDAASPFKHTCVTVKDDITHAQWAKMKAEYTNCVQNPQCKGCMTTIKKYVPILVQAGKLDGEGEVGVNYISSDDKKYGVDYMTQWGKTLHMREGDDIIYHVTDNEPVTIDGHVNGLVPAGGKRKYDVARMRYRFIGLYAPPGEIVTITVPEEMCGKLEAVIGVVHYNEYTIQNFPPMKGNVLKIASPWGGPIVLRLTKKDAIKEFFEKFHKTTFTVRVNNALRAPTFVYGKHTDDDWKTTLRNYAPKWAILTVPGQVSIYVQTLRIKHIDNMNETMSKIKNSMDLLEEMMGLPPNSKPGADIWIFNPGTGGGWRGGGNCQPGTSNMGDWLYKEKREEEYGVLAEDKRKDDKFFKFGFSGLVGHEAGHGWCYGDLPSNGGQWTAETVRRYIEYKKGMVTDKHLNMDDMDSPDLDFPLLYRMVSFKMYSYGSPCGRADFSNTPLYTGAYDNCWKWLNWIPEKAHGWDVYKEVNTLDVQLDTRDLSSTDRMMYLYCKATKHNMLPLFQLYNLRPNKNKVKETCEKLPKSILIDKWLDIVTCITGPEVPWRQISGEDCWSSCGKKGGPCPSFCGIDGYCCRKGYSGCTWRANEASPKHHTCVTNKKISEGSLSSRGVDIRDCAKMPHFPKHKGLCVLNGVCQNDKANGGQTTTMKNKFDLYGSTGKYLSKKYSSDKEKNCLQRAVDFFKDCKNTNEQKITATFYSKEPKKDVSYTHPPLVPWRQISDEDCWTSCGKKGGPCPNFCGTEAYCCRKGYEQTDNCPTGTAEASPSKHTCVTQKEISKAWRQKNTKDCWVPCEKKGGPCPAFCGSNGFCCRRGYGGCPKEAAEVSTKHHTCVIKKG